MLQIFLALHELFETAGEVLQYFVDHSALFQQRSCKPQHKTSVM